MAGKLTRQTHQYCIKCGENMHDYGQKNCRNCHANLEKEESKTYDSSIIQKRIEAEYLKKVLEDHRRSRL